MLLKSFILLCLVLGVLCKTQLVVQKTFLTNHLVAENNLIVNAKIFNVGQSTAYDLEYTDNENWNNTNFDLVVGLTSVKWESLAPGANVSHTFVVLPHVYGYFNIPPAMLQYRDTPAGHVETILSSTPGYVLIEPASEFEKRSSPHLREWAIFFLLSLGSISLPFAVFRFYQTNYEKGVKKQA